MLLADALKDSTTAILIGPPLLLQVGQAEVLIVYNKGRLCYCVLDQGEKVFEGDYSRQTPRLVREFLKWSSSKLKDLEVLKKAIQKQRWT